jgi:hypothetical protein
LHIAVIKTLKTGFWCLGGVCLSGLCLSGVCLTGVCLTEVGHTLYCQRTWTES